jgi:prolyl-tRNA editing enzyme YbaK/EbsC (Cys-tRNA(Pro) deacylase)
VTALAFGQLHPVPARERPDLLGGPVRAFLDTWPQADQVAVVEIDPELADTAAMTQAYGVPLEASANCVVVSGRREGAERFAACLVRADTRADVNNVVKRLLDVRKASFLATERAVDLSGMAYGGITPIGLPGSWRLLVSDLVAAREQVVVGSGTRTGKLLLPGAALLQLPGAELVPDLALR